LQIVRCFGVKRQAPAAAADWHDGQISLRLAVFSTVKRLIFDATGSGSFRWGRHLHRFSPAGV